MAKPKQATTIATQRALVALDLAVAMCTRPWMVEFSKKSRNVAVVIGMDENSRYKLLFKNPLQQGHDADWLARLKGWRLLNFFNIIIKDAH